MNDEWLDGPTRQLQEAEISIIEFKELIAAKFAEQSVSTYQNGESSGYADWINTLEEYLDIEVEGPSELVSKLKELEQCHQAELDAAVLETLQTVLQEAEHTTECDCCANGGGEHDLTSHLRMIERYISAVYPDLSGERGKA